MTWFRVDDSFWGHPKRMACPPAALGLWVTAGSWCAQQLTDGYVPRHALTALGGRARDAAALVAAGLWEVADDGWRFHDWLDRQPSRDQVMARREADASRQTRWRDARRRSAQPSVTPQISPSTESSGDDASTSVASTDAKTVVAWWVQLHQRRPPSRLIGQVAKEVKLLLDDDFPAETIRAGLQMMYAKGLNPSTLASLVNETNHGPTASDLRPHWTPPAPPPEIADDPERYLAWMREQHDLHRRTAS